MSKMLIVGTFIMGMLVGAWMWSLELPLKLKRIKEASEIANAVKITIVLIVAAILIVICSSLLASTFHTTPQMFLTAILGAGATALAVAKLSKGD